MITIWLMSKDPEIPTLANHFTSQDFLNLPKLAIFYTICISWRLLLPMPHLLAK